MAATSEQMWTSKLGNKYPMAWMQQNDQASQKALKALRSLKDSGNCFCADCGRQDNTWASVSHGVFICVTCSDVHRSVGTHITKVKGCTGTYLWGPDELDKMKTVGNRGGDEFYGAEKIDPAASKEQKQQYVTEKYEKRSFAGKAALAPAKVVSTSARAEQPNTSVVRRAERTAPASNAGAVVSPQQVAVTSSPAPSARAAEIPTSLFDELFNDAEDSYFGISAFPLKSSTTQVVTDNGLDAFLNSTLQKPAANATVTDPFFSDWPTF